MAWLVALGWLGTNLGIAVADLPLKFELKDGLGLSAAAVSGFFVIGNFTNYVKPIAGMLTDSFPLFGTRRRSYLLLSLAGSGILWVVLSLVPRTFAWMLGTYAVLYSTIVLTSTTLGGVMVEIGQRHAAEGRLTAQRIAMFRVGSLFGQPIGGLLARCPFIVAMSAASALHLVLVPLYYFRLPEPPAARADRRVWSEAAAQLRRLARSRTLLGAAGMILLVAISPGFGTPLLFYQADTLHFSRPFIGTLGLIGAGCGIPAAVFYYRSCRRISVRWLLAASIMVHALGTLTYLAYRSPLTAVVVTGLAGATLTLATLPVYDLATRATPRGCEALGYSMMMSVWNLTNALSDWSGSALFSHWHLTFLNLVWLNAGSTALVLLAVPLVPQVLLRARDA